MSFSITIISGGQTGVDRAALDAAMSLGIPVGGWCPKGRLAEDGRLDPLYPLRETATSYYTERTKKNVTDSDGTLIIAGSELSGGTALTASYAKRMRMPLYIVDVESYNPGAVVPFRQWLGRNGISVLNVAGPRESSYPGIYQRAFCIVNDILESL